ncbi:MAG: hypothetical protein IJQ05_01665 [Bacteroidaceae bacterium]|nr:hypothetical protein [Bacteroidaceae bacterium]
MKKIIFFISMIFFYAASTYAQSEDWRGGYEELLDEQEGVTTKGKVSGKRKIARTSTWFRPVTGVILAPTVSS